MQLNIVRPGLLSAVVILGLAGSAMSAGPTSVLYATNYHEFGLLDSAGLDRIQGTSVDSTPTGNFGDEAIAVSGDVRTLGYYSGYSGSRFDLNANLLPGGPYNAGPGDYLYTDGTSDCTHNYSVDWVTGNVDQFDRNWQNKTSLFNPDGAHFAYGITIDMKDGSFWITHVDESLNNPIKKAEHYSHAGAFLSSFNIGDAGAIALDPADGTLWVDDTAFSQHHLEQFDQSGTLLRQLDFNNSLKGIFYGLEFNTAPVPEPTSMTVLGLAGLAILRRRRRS